MNRWLTEVDEEDLIQAAREEDRAAFDILYRRYVQRIYRYCYSRVGSHADAEDLTAQTFLAALQGLPDYEGRSAFSVWLFGIAHYKCADHHRRRYAHPGAPLEAAEALTDGGALDPEREACNRDLLDCLREALQQLSPDRREALQLRFWAGLKHQEVATLMERSADAVKMLVWRAVGDLRERCLDGEA